MMVRAAFLPVQCRRGSSFRRWCPGAPGRCCVSENVPLPREPRIAERPVRLGPPAMRGWRGLPAPRDKGFAPVARPGDRHLFLYSMIRKAAIRAATTAAAAQATTVTSPEEPEPWSTTMVGGTYSSSVSGKSQKTASYPTST